MTLFLSRLELDPRHPQTQSELVRPYEMHRTLAKAFEDLPGSRVLFRADQDRPGRACVLVQSRLLPDWSLAELPHVESIDVKPLALAGVEAGSRLRFRLLCRPTKRPAGGSRIVLKTPEELFQWLGRKGAEGGFQVEEASLDRVYWSDSRSEVRGKGYGVEKTKTPGMRQRIKEDEPLLCAVRFDGVLLVTDASALRETVAQGIGTQKAFGFGLLSLARVM